VGPVGVGHEQRRGRVRQVVQHQRAGIEQPQGRTGLRDRKQHHRQRTGRGPAGAFRGGDQGVLTGAAEQLAGELFELAFAGTAAHGQFVGVARGAGGGQLVDVGERQLGELGHHLGRQTRRHRTRCQPAPRDPRADPVGAEQRVHRPAVAHLAAPQLIRGLARVATGGRAARQVEVVSERGAHGAPYRAAHPAGQRVRVARHLVDDRLDDLVRGRPQRRAQHCDRRLIQGQFCGPTDRSTHLLFPANNMRRADSRPAVRTLRQRTDKLES
jgi:hypothetical protein